MRLYVIRMQIRKTEEPVVQYFLSDQYKGTKHYAGDGFPLIRETPNCWHIETAPPGLPVRYRKREEYSLAGNHEGFYMFGRNCPHLLGCWNQVVGGQRTHVGQQTTSLVQAKEKETEIVNENPINHSIDEAKVRQAVRLFLDGIGEDPDREGLIDTPDRVARMCRELFAGLGQDAEPHLRKVFTTESSGLVMEKNIRFYSLCEHHLMPFWGYAHIAYLPDGKVTGLSKLARTVEVFARRPQIQENLTHQIMDALVRMLHPKGVMVVIEAEHMCMSMRGIKKDGAKTVTTAVAGSLKKDLAFQNAFLQSIG